MSERLSKFLSRAGVASRRKSEDIIASGRVTVNDTVATAPSYQVISGRDVVAIEGVSVNPVQRLVYIALYKPVGYISDLADPRGRRIARELIPVEAPLFPVGRLDYSSEGLLLFTNDGAFANHIMHPRYETEKEYVVKVRGRLTENELRQMVIGVRIGSEQLRVRSVTPIPENSSVNGWYKMVLAEGKNRMIRRISDALRHPVLKLRRVRIDGITLAGLRPGQYRHIDRQIIRPFLVTGQTKGPDTEKVLDHAGSRDKFH